MKYISHSIVFLFLTIIHYSYSWCQNVKLIEKSQVLCVDYSTDGTLIVITTNQSVTIWQRRTKRMMFMKLVANAECAKFSKDSPSSLIAISSQNMMVQVISAIVPFSSIHTFNVGTGTGVAVIDFTQNQQVVTCGDGSNLVKIWSVSSGSATNIYNYNINHAYCLYLGNNKIATAQTSTIQVHDLIPPGSSSILDSQNINNCKGMSLSAGNSILAACDSGIKMDISTYNVVVVMSSAMKTSASYRMADETVAYADNNIVYIVNGSSNNNSVISKFMYRDVIKTIDFSNDGLNLLVGTSDGFVYEYSKYCNFLNCKPGYYRNSTTKLCEYCSDVMKGCTFCTNSSVCIQCQEYYVLDSLIQTCKLCSDVKPNCVTCINSNTCRYCAPGYYLQNNDCFSCQSIIPGCYECTRNKINGYITCLQCSSNFYISGNYPTTNNMICIQCNKADPKCLKCTTAGFCTQCAIGYYTLSGVCYQCPINCYMCKSAIICIDCLSGYYTFATGGNSTAITCVKCPPGCLTCNNTGFCLDCVDERYQNVNGTCTLCPYPCSTCQSSSYCLSCIVGYFWDITGLCLECSNGCITCNSSSICLSCSPGYYLDSTLSVCVACQKSTLFSDCMQCTENACLKCHLGFYLANSTSNTTICINCTQVMIGCISCASSIICNFCAAGYYLSAGSGNMSCLACKIGCSTCISYSNCTNCYPTYYLVTASGSCMECVPNCISCITSNFCLECSIGYSLGLSGICVSCNVNISNCILCVANGSIQCLDCQPGFYLMNNSCQYCSDMCTTCSNDSICLSCQIGSYLDQTLHQCFPCHFSCALCRSSATNCTSCTSGHYLTTTNKCEHCSVFGCETCNSTTHDCISCPIGYYLKTVSGFPSQICDKCPSAISRCQICNSSTACTHCSYGYGLSANSSSCQSCNIIDGCKHCIFINSCLNCQIGYYLTLNGLGNGECARCSIGCKECNATGVCLLCLPKYYYVTTPSVSCKLCQSTLNGCQICSNSLVCTVCLPGYYLNSTSHTCKICSSSIFTCKLCNSSSICTYCQDGYYLNSNNCTKCQSALVGCLLCNSSSVCLTCEYGMYLSSNKCFQCINSLSNCLYCKNSSSCLQCDFGYFLATDGTCNNCQVQITGCTSCISELVCLKCRSGYYLNTTSQLCEVCEQKGCDICVQTDPNQCFKCNSQYYMNISTNTCQLCLNNIQGCVLCSNATQCIDCNIGYFINVLSLCSLCSSTLPGCGICKSSTSCIQCQATYYLASDYTCQQCKLPMPGCAFCTSNSTCQSCYHGYFLTSSFICSPCTAIKGCLSCLNQTYCQYCQNSYFYDTNDNLCYPCSVMIGCYACTSNSTCTICKGGYVFNDEQVCQVMKIYAHDTITDLKLVTKFVNESYLIHQLLARNMKYNKSQDIDWNRTTKLVVEDSQYKQTNLTIYKVEWRIDKNTLIFNTDNPLHLLQNNFQIVRRLLAGSPLKQTYKVNLKMEQSTINQILPSFYLPKDLVMGYDLSQPQFIMSYSREQSKLWIYSIVGYVILGFFALKYFIKAVCTVPASSQMGDIIPDIAALKSPALVLYPIYYQLIFYCQGFMLPDLPWLNQFFAKMFVDKSDVSSKPYAIYYYNMNIGSTFFLALIIGIISMFILWLFYKNKQNEQYKSRYPIGTVCLNFYIFGAVWAGCASLQGALLNPIQSINLNSALYIVGIIFYFVILTFVLFWFIQDRKNMYMMRIFIKASLLSAANISAIYIFSISILLDVVLLIIQYKLTAALKQFPKIWITKHIFCDLALCVVMLFPNIMLSLITSSALAVVVLLMDTYTHLKQYSNRDKIIKPEVKTYTQNNSFATIGNTEGFNFEKQYDIQNQIHKDKINDQFKDGQEIDQQTSFNKTASVFIETNPKQFKIGERRSKYRNKTKTQKPEIITVNSKIGETKIKKVAEQSEDSDNSNTFVPKYLLNKQTSSNNKQSIKNKAKTGKSKKQQEEIENENTFVIKNFLQ